jgi:hypothetical protein
LPSTLDEYFTEAFITGAINLMGTVCYMSMGKVAGLDAFEWLQSKPRIYRPASIIARVTDDLLSYEVSIVTRLKYCSYMQLLIWKEKNKNLVA